MDTPHIAYELELGRSQLLDQILVTVDRVLWQPIEVLEHVLAAIHHKVVQRLEVPVDDAARRIVAAVDG